MPLFSMVFCFIPTTCSSFQVCLRTVVLKGSLIYSLVPVTVLKPPMLAFTYRKIRYENTVGNTLAFQFTPCDSDPLARLLNPPVFF